jgi:pyruvate,orthophosphate dikinase
VATTTGGKMVYGLTEGSADMVSLLGSKGAHASEMARNGVPVPPGFVITTEACREYLRLHHLPEGLWESIVVHVHALEKETGRRFGDAAEPLVVSVRSGAAVSMPGMMDTILNMGVTDDTWRGLAAMMGDERPALDAYRRFVQGFGSVVLGIDRGRFESLLDEAKAQRGLTFDYELDPSALTDLVERYKGVVREAAGAELPQDPWDLLRQAVEAVFISWNNPRANTYRDFHGIPHDLGTGCTIMAMVFGNLGLDSGTGVLFTRSPATGEKMLYGEFLTNAQGEDVVAGVRTPARISQLARDMPEVYTQLEGTARKLEAHYREVQDIEFTVERGKLYILQTRTAKRTALAAVKIAVDFVGEEVLSRKEALGRIGAENVPQILLPRFEEKAKAKAVSDGRLFAEGGGGSPGAASGILAMDPDRAVELAASGRNVILVRAETSPDDVHGIMKAKGVLTARGGMTSHAAVVTRGLGKAAVVGCEELSFDGGTVSARGTVLHEGDVISIDGASGEVFVGEIETRMPFPAELAELTTLLGWADAESRLQVWANADTPEQAKDALELGAQGIGLCRTEHMFFDPTRLPHVQRMLAAGPEASRTERQMETLREQLAQAPASERESLRTRLADAETHIRESEQVRVFQEELGRLGEFQTADFYGILKVMAGMPVVIRLMDAPLHEFLPDDESLRESNPMLGHRGMRVGLTMPEVYEMQVRSIFTAAARLTKEGVSVKPEVMIPIVSHVNELRWLHPRLARVITETLAAEGAAVPYKFGTMIEVPRAALTAAEIAGEAEFFSFGSNDLTQMTFAYSRDDAEQKFLRQYVKEEVLPWNPFDSLDTTGVGRLMRIATEEGRAVNPGLVVGICGEHGGDPRSVAFCHELGLNYVSCSPFRVPGARLAAAQSALGQLKPGAE